MTDLMQGLAVAALVLAFMVMASCQDRRIRKAQVENQQLIDELEDQRAAKKTAAGAADRFRDVLSEALGHPDKNPGDDVLVAELREHFGKTGPEPTRWREFLAGAEAIRDQINARYRDTPTDGGSDA